jgi:hypothetical protein
MAAPLWRGLGGGSIRTRKPGNQLGRTKILDRLEAERSQLCVQRRRLERREKRFACRPIMGNANGS